MISLSDKHFLLELARRTLNMYLQTGELPDLQTDSPVLREPRATFVTLRARPMYSSAPMGTVGADGDGGYTAIRPLPSAATGDLRGCRGETEAHQPLIESVARMTIASATDDPRFPPVKALEIPNLHIEINALTPLTPIQPHEINIGRHGLMIVKGNYGGLLLPEVAVRYDWDAETFLRAVCRKAGLRENAWIALDAKLFGFEAEVWGEE